MANIVKGEGVPDFVLLEELTEDAMFQNIRIRYDKDRIYSYIGEVVVSMNPYKTMNIYTKAEIDDHRGRYMYERQPHIFALANNAFRSMNQNRENQCVIISGESGAGKTEASKKIMQFISAVSKSTADVDRVKNQLLDSNPVLEAFGNAKTLRNDNSSRFGKYMEIQFNHAGAPIGGRINIYLLEKSRVVTRTIGERSFHIFYQLLKGLTDAQLKEYHLSKDPNSYAYLAQSKCTEVDTVNDARDFKDVKRGMETLGFTPAHQDLIWRIIGAILMLGNVNFQIDKTHTAVGESKVSVTDFSLVETIANLLECDPYRLKDALISRQISTGVSRRMSVIHIHLDEGQAKFTRDALAKALYSLLFTWLVEHINKTIHANVPRAETLVIGVLDIYGFEIFEKNSFEQFCINYCNEKLQQLFIELTLKTEQEEYVREGIKWTPVEYFNNKIICDLIDGKPLGVVSLLDESCLVANSTDISFLDKMNRNFKHKHYESYGTTNNRQIPSDAFRLKHYAGDVTYCVEGFLEKNKDTLFVDLINAMLTTKNAIFPELFKSVNTDTKKRPVTAGTQFKTSLAELVDNLLKCRPHYTRCIKPNANKRPGVLDEALVRHQIRYLGLVENLRVRRAGFANRQTYDRFLRRYKMLATATWPRWRGDDQSGSQAIIDEVGLPKDEYSMGKTKVFIKNPTTLFSLEEKREQALPKVVILIQKVFRGFNVRRRLAKNQAALRILLFYRHHRSAKFLHQIQNAYSGVKNDPKFGKDIHFPEAPNGLKAAETSIKKIFNTWRAKKIIARLGSKEAEAEMRQKCGAYDIFQGKKPWDFRRKYEADYLELDSNPYKAKYIERSRMLFSTYGDTQVNFADFANKVNRYNKIQKVGIVVTDRNIYKQDPKNYKVVKFGIPIANLHSISMSPFKDSIVVCHCKEESGMRDLILNFGVSGSEKYAEFVVTVTQLFNHLTNSNLPVKFVENIVYNNSRTKAKSGTTSSLSFMATTVQNTTFQKGKGNQHQILYPQS